MGSDDIKYFSSKRVKKKGREDGRDWYYDPCFPFRKPKESDPPLDQEAPALFEENLSSSANTNLSEILTEWSKRDEKLTKNCHNAEDLFKLARRTLVSPKKITIPPLADMKRPNRNPVRINRMDILSSLHLADKLFKDYRREKAVLVLFSDMIEDSADYNFEKEHLTGKRIGQIIQKEKGRNRLPDLKKAKVFIVAAGAPSSQKFFDIQNFWLAYFKECGAELAKENYGSTLVKFEE